MTVALWTVPTLRMLVPDAKSGVCDNLFYWKTTCTHMTVLIHCRYTEFDTKLPVLCKPPTSCSCEPEWNRNANLYIEYKECNCCWLWYQVSQLGDTFCKAFHYEMKTTFIFYWHQWGLLYSFHCLCLAFMYICTIHALCILFNCYFLYADLKWCSGQMWPATQFLQLTLMEQDWGYW